MMTLDRKYRDELQLALRARDISGERVGEVLAEVDTHVAATGQDPSVAFGPPRDYAKQIVDQLDTSTGKPHTARHLAGTLATGALIYIGASFLLDGILTGGGTVAVTPADALSWPIMLIALVAGTHLLMRAVTTPRHGKAYGIASACAFAAVIAAGPVIDWLGDEQTSLLDMQAWITIVVGSAFLAGAAVMLAQAIKRGKIIDPRKHL